MARKHSPAKPAAGVLDLMLREQNLFDVIMDVELAAGARVGVAAAVSLSLLRTWKLRK